MNKRNYTSYKSELRKELVCLNRKIKAAEKLVYKTLSPQDEQFFSAYDKLNELRLKRKTINSRIANIGRESQPITEYELPQKQE